MTWCEMIGSHLVEDMTRGVTASHEDLRICVCGGIGFLVLVQCIVHFYRDCVVGFGVINSFVVCLLIFSDLFCFVLEFLPCLSTFLFCPVHN